MKKIVFTVFALVIFLIAFETEAARAGKILFIPHDDRPISFRQTAEIVEQTGAEMILPPEAFLSNTGKPGDPDRLWTWLEKNAHAANSAVISSDSLLYGGLIPSRKHDIPAEVLNSRLENFEKLHRENPNLKIYVFDSLMRTPQTGTRGDVEEPNYYVFYGKDIFQYTRLADKREIGYWSQTEENKFRALEKKIPPQVLSDWFERRAKNISATKKLMEFAGNGTIEYLILGRDDNSPLCQTHRENREILAFAEKINLPKTKFQSLAGIDEFNILLLARAINEKTGENPKVCVVYNLGVGGDTVPAFSDEKISQSIDSAVNIVGGKKVRDPEKADFVLMVNTDEHGKTFFIHNEKPAYGAFRPILNPNESTANFARAVESYVKEGYPVGIADVDFLNGSDNALMEILKKRKLLFKIQSYAGMNTATNSAGFALGTGILAKKMSKSAKRKLLLTRYLDDWIYQANVRTIVGKEILKNFGDASLYYHLGDKIDFAEDRNTALVREYAEKKFPDFNFEKNLIVKNSWNRMFECDIIFKAD